MRLFVQIPAYRDTEISATLLELYGKAAAPNDIRTCVLWQRAEDESLAPGVAELPNLELLEVSHHESQGCNWARGILQSHWRDEPFSLLLDSHHRFVEGWDTQLLEMYQACAARSPKPLITAYLPAYSPENDPAGRRLEPYKTYPLERDGGVLSRLTSYPMPFWQQLTAPPPADFVCLHFLFAAGNINKEITFDPEMYYLRDEIMASVQAYTAGYDFFHPHRVIAWHCYDRASRRPHWVDHEDWHTSQPGALAKMRRLFKGADPDAAGLVGTTRSIPDYEAQIMMRLVVDERAG